MMTSYKETETGFRKRAIRSLSAVMVLRKKNWKRELNEQPVKIYLRFCVLWASSDLQAYCRHCTTKAYRGITGITPLILNLGARWM
jgi:hypothetical protein